MLLNSVQSIWGRTDEKLLPSILTFVWYSRKDIFAYLYTPIPEWVHNFRTKYAVVYGIVLKIAMKKKSLTCCDLGCDGESSLISDDSSC